MLQSLFHAWERRLASAATDRVVRPFDWGLDWIPPNGPGAGARPPDVFGDWVAGVMHDTDAFFTPAPMTDYRIADTSRPGERLLTFPSALDTPHPENNTVYSRCFRGRGATRAAVVVLPQWNSDGEGHVGLCRLLRLRARAGADGERRGKADETGSSRDVVAVGRHGCNPEGMWLPPSGGRVTVLPIQTRRGSAR